MITDGYTILVKLISLLKEVNLGGEYCTTLPNSIDSILDVTSFVK